jgi:hypothetical protein
LETFESNIEAGEEKVKGVLAQSFKEYRAMVARAKYDAAAQRGAARRESDDAASRAAWSSFLRRAGW